jgi:putative membrane protein
MRRVPANILRGFLMGAADIVPGVSGGTIALVLGIYRRLVASIRSGSSALGALLSLRWVRAKEWLAQVEWSLLIPLLIGIAIAIATLAGILEHQLETNPIPMAGLFLGLVAGSAVVAWGLLGRRDARRLAIVVATAIVVFVALGLRGGTTEEAVGQLAEPATWAFIAAGAVAIWAMILPGISGSFILVLLGMYSPVLGAVNDRDFAVLGVFIVGAIVGLALFSQVLHWALETHHDAVMAILVGLMAGSLRVLWPWPGGVDSTALGTPDEAILLSTVLAVTAFAVVIGVSAMAAHRETAPPAAADSAATSSTPQR